MLTKKMYYPNNNNKGNNKNHISTKYFTKNKYNCKIFSLLVYYLYTREVY